MSTPNIITDEKEIAVYNINKAATPTKEPRFDYSPFRRLSARIIDDFIASIASIIIVAVFVGMSFAVPNLLWLWIVLGFLLILTFQTLYKPLLEYYYNQTPGQRINSLLLTTEKGDKPTFILLFLRSLLEWLNAFFPIHIVSVFTVPLRDDRQSVSDLICNTRVETTKVYPNMVLWSSITSIVAFITPFIVMIAIIIGFFAWAGANPSSSYPSSYYSDYDINLDRDYDDELQKEISRINSEIATSSISVTSIVNSSQIQGI